MPNNKVPSSDSPTPQALLPKVLVDLEKLSFGVHDIQRDAARARDILHGRIKRDLKKYLTGEKPIQGGGEGNVLIPVPTLDPPHFVHGTNGNRGASVGDLPVGTPLTPPQKKKVPGDPGDPSNEPAQHELLFPIPVVELGELLAEELELRHLEPKQSGDIVIERTRYSGIAPVGPDAQIHRQRSFKRALKRQMASDPHYVPGTPFSIEREDRRYRAGKPVVLPRTQADVIFLRDFSGSIDDQARSIISLESAWIELFVQTSYKNVRTHFVVHDEKAKFTDRNEFYQAQSAGGTNIAEAMRLVADGISGEAPMPGVAKFEVSATNVYLIYFGDGDASTDNCSQAKQVITDRLLKQVNLFGYVEISTGYGRGDFLGSLEDADLNKLPNVALSAVDSAKDIPTSLKDLFGKKAKGMAKK